MKRRQLIDELRIFLDSSDLGLKEALQIDKAIDVLIQNHGFLTVVDGAHVGGTAIEFGVDKETGILYCGKPGDAMLPVTQKELDNLVDVVQNIHRKLEEKLAGK